MLTDRSYVKLMSISGNEYEVKTYSRLDSFFQYPVDSRDFSIVEVNDSNLSGRSVITLLDFESHCYKLPSRNGFVIIPIL